MGVKRSKSYKEALSQVDLKEMTPDAAYDFGQVAFRSGDDANALKAFSQIPNGHALYDLAGYFGGISALRSGEYQRAIDMFDQAWSCLRSWSRRRRSCAAKQRRSFYRSREATRIRPPRIPAVNPRRRSPPTSS